MKAKNYISSLLLTFATASFAQVNIGSELASHASSILEVTSTEKGLLPPRLTETQRNAIANPAAGLTIYNITEKCVNFYSGTGWASFCNDNTVFITKPINYRIGGNAVDHAYDIQQTKDGGYIMVGTSGSTASGDKTRPSKGGNDIWVVKLKADGTIDWENNYGGSRNETVNSIKQTTDGGYIVGGGTLSSATGDMTGTLKGLTDAWILKLDAAGGIIWQRNYGGSGIDTCSDILQTRDGGYIFGGRTTSSASGDVTETSKGAGDGWLVKLMADGTIDWQKNYGGSVGDALSSITLTADGGYFVTGYTSSSASGDVAGTSKGGQDVWVLKLDASGIIIWEKNYGGSGLDQPESVQLTTDGGYIVAGFTNSSASGDVTGISQGGYDTWILKLDVSGNITWQKNYNGSGDDRAFSVQQTSDGGYIVAGETTSSVSGDMTGNSKGGYDYWVLKLDASGNITWQKNYGTVGYDHAQSIIQTTDGKYMVAGYTSDFANTGDQLGLTSRGSYDFWVITLDENGNILP